MTGPFVWVKARLCPVQALLIFCPVQALLTRASLFLKRNCLHGETWLLSLKVLKSSWTLIVLVIFAVHFIKVAVPSIEVVVPFIELLVLFF